MFNSLEKDNNKNTFSLKLDLKKAIIGKWRTYSSNDFLGITFETEEHIEFFHDGTVSIYIKELNLSLVGNYKFISFDKIRINFSGIYSLLGSMIFTISVSGNKLYMKSENGKTDVYEKIEGIYEYYDRNYKSNYEINLFNKKYDWSFVIISDLHIGYDSRPRDIIINNKRTIVIDYGEDGFDENDKCVTEDTEISNRLNKVINEIIKNKNKEKIVFVVLLGDISDSAEYSEFLKASEILKKLSNNGIPYIPIFGNHDDWPYIQFASNPDQRPVRIDNGCSKEPIGDKYFKNLLIDGDSKNVNLLRKLLNIYVDITLENAYLPILQGDYDQSIKESFFEGKIKSILNFTKRIKNEMQNKIGITKKYNYLFNYGFNYGGITFICLDLVKRKISDFDAEDWPETINFAKNYLNFNPSDIIVIFTHYSTNPKHIPSKYLGLNKDNYIMPKKVYWFGGHVHYNGTSEEEVQIGEHKIKCKEILTQEFSGKIRLKESYFWGTISLKQPWRKDDKIIVRKVKVKKHELGQELEIQDWIIN